MAPGYLIDTNTVNYWYNDRLPEHANVALHVEALDESSPLYVSVVTLAEVEFGLQSTTTPDPAKQAALRQFLASEFPDPVPITGATVEHYAAIRVRLFQTYPPQGRRQRRPEQCFDPVTATQLNIDENDLWIAAQAMERKLVLVTHDGMARIAAVTRGLLTIEDWTEPL